MSTPHRDRGYRPQARRALHSTSDASRAARSVVRAMSAQSSHFQLQMQNTAKIGILATCESMSVVSTRIPWLDIRTFHTHLIAIVAIVCVVSVKARAPKTAHCFLHQITHVNQRGRSVQAAHARGVQSHHPTSARLTAHGTRATRWRKPCAKSSARRRATASRKLMLRSRV